MKKSLFRSAVIICLSIIVCLTFFGCSSKAEIVQNSFTYKINSSAYGDSYAVYNFSVKVDKQSVEKVEFAVGCYDANGKLVLTLNETRNEFLLPRENNYEFSYSVLQLNASVKTMKIINIKFTYESNYSYAIGFGVASGVLMVLLGVIVYMELVKKKRLKNNQ